MIVLLVYHSDASGQKHLKMDDNGTERSREDPGYNSNTEILHYHN